MQRSSEPSGGEIAVIGMSGRFPGAKSVEALWENLKNGVESVTPIGLEEWAAELGVAPCFIDRPEYVRMRPQVDGASLFDAAFFGYSPREAQILDPQQRLFLECAWEALENAGYDCERFPGAVGVAAGVSLSSYLMNYVQWDRELVASLGNLKIGIANMHDSLTTRVAYKLNLRGAAYAVQSFCSTSLVAVHLACQSLLNRESDMVLAGGVTIAVPQNIGYQYQEGGILSSDGHTRTFDAKGSGMVFGNGLGVVLLKRLQDALRDGDQIRAVILGTAVNNDGSMKVGYTAPSVSGQAEVIVEALSAADVNPETISYVEAHGTATALGDPAEIAGLTKAWRKWTDKKRYCAIGSIKTNIGHLDAAAGVAGLIKTVLALENRQIPRSLHFETPNPQIDFEGSPFYVATELLEWKSEGPRRAGLSSFGVGGTNAHAILQEAPVQAPTDPARPGQLLVLSAKTASALEQATRNLAAHLAAHPDQNLADVAWTLQIGRRVFSHRRVLVCQDSPEALSALADPALLDGAVQDRQGAPVAFMFTGQGSQYVGMGRGLYEQEPAFRDAIDTCCTRLREPLGLDLRELILGDPGNPETAEQLKQTRLTQPALFTIEYALSRLWASWGLSPVAMIGHSVGEYVAAHLAGVFSLEDALDLVAERGRLMQAVRPGAMLAVPLGQAALAPLLGSEVDLASVNTPSSCVVAGPFEAIERLEKDLVGRGLAAKRLVTSHAFHSAMMEEVLPAFVERVRQTERRAPGIRFVSNLTGTWITAEQATDPAYWGQHLRRAVRFSDGVRTLLSDESAPVLLELGPGNTLVSFARQQPGEGGAPPAVASLRHPRETMADRTFLLGSLGKLWLLGVKIDWERVHAGERRRRVAVPSYPFERQHYWVEKNRERQEMDAISLGQSAKRNPVADWFYQPTWRRSLPTGLSSPPVFPQGGSRWLLFLDDQGLGDVIARQLRAAGQVVVTVRAGKSLGPLGPGEYEMDPRHRADYVGLLKLVMAAGQAPDFALHLWGVTSSEGDGSPLGTRLDAAQDRGFFSLLFLAQALGRVDFKQPLTLAVITSHMQDVIGGDLLHPEKATVLGPCRVIPQELKNVACHNIDVDLPARGSTRESTLARWIVGELVGGQGDRFVAYRGPHRWVPALEHTPLTEQSSDLLRDRGVYLITGGLGGIGLVLAQHLAEAYRGRLVLTGRSGLPPAEEWSDWLLAKGPEDATSRRIIEIRSLEAKGAEVAYLAADVAKKEDMERAVAVARTRFGTVNGVVHSAGVAGGGLVQLKEPDVAARVLAPKVQGTVNLMDALAGEPLDFVLLCSSSAALLGGVGQVDYCGANAFLDAFAHHTRSNGGPLVLSVNWDAWRDVGMAVNTAVSGALQAARDFSLKVGIAPAEGVDAFGRILAAGAPQVLVHTMDLRPALIKAQWMRKQAKPAVLATEGAVDGSTPADGKEPAAPVGSDLERVVIDAWEKVLGRPQIGVGDNFFELGGDSLSALQVVAILKGSLGRDVSIVTFYEAPTVALLARALGEGEAAGKAAVTLEEVGQRAETRLELMQKRRQKRGAAVVLDSDQVRS